MSEKILLKEILENFPNAKILVGGDVMLDRYWFGDASRLSPEAPVPIVALRETKHIPGGAANVAANIAGFGAKVFLVGVIGNDDSAVDLRRALDKFEIASDFLIASETRPTTTKTRVLVHHQQLARVDYEVKIPLDKSDEKKTISQILDLIPEVDLIILSDYAKGCLTENLISKVVSEARKFEKVVLVDPKSRDFTRYNGTTMLTPNLAEALVAADADDLDKGIEKIFAKVEIESLLVTLGENGMKLFQRNAKPIHFPSTARQVFDVTGAGDTVIAALAVALAVKADIHSAIALANIAAGLAVEKVGTSIVSLGEIQKALI